MKKFHWAFRCILSAGISVAALLLVDVASVFIGCELSMKLRLVMLLAVAGIVFWGGPKSSRGLSVIFGALMACIVVPLSVFYGCLNIFSNHSDYQNPDMDGGVKSFFAEQKVMLIVPHQDDELNVMGGTLEEYARNGSEVYVVYLTNGDKTPAELRFTEAIRCLAKQGVPEDHVIFLGYGDQWREAPHLYNAASGEIKQSVAGFYATYGTAEHPAYREGADYTIDNMLADMESVILEYKPDVIYCCDYDSHGEHKATSMVFEKAMGRILKRGSDYQPKVFKGFAYRTAWFAEDDFYELNIKSTTKYYDEDYVLPIDHYRWDDRVRLPVNASGLSRSLPGSGQYDLLETHASQKAYEHAGKVINGDRVFWERYTTSVCNSAEIHVTSGNGDVLNDFMLLDTVDLLDGLRWPCDGTWYPDEADTEKKVTVILPEKTDLTDIILYDNPDHEQNVLEAVITFDNGERIMTGPLDPIGAPTVIAVDQKQVASFDVQILSGKGQLAGLTEIEAFTGTRRNDRGFVQLMDMEGEFVYDYITDTSGELMLYGYYYGTVPELVPENYTVSGDNERCTVRWTEEGIAVFCPVGETVTVTIATEDAGIWDRVHIQNPGILRRLWIKIGQHGENLAQELNEAPQKMDYHLNLWGERILQKLGAS